MNARSQTELAIEEQVKKWTHIYKCIRIYIFAYLTW